MKQLLFTLLLTAALPLSALELSDITQTYVYHGAIQTAAGTAPSIQSCNITFALYEFPSGGTALWSETQEITLDSTGSFVAELGATGPESATMLADAFDSKNALTYYLGISVEGAEEITPRQRIRQSPSVIHAMVGNGSFKDFPITGDARVTGSLWANTIDATRLTLNADNPGSVSVKNTATFHTRLKVKENLTLAGQATVPQIRVAEVKGPMIKGMIIPWYDTTGTGVIPEGWALCDGTNGTPNLIGYYPRPAGNATPLGDTWGGFKLQPQHLPEHIHVGSHERRSDWRNVMLAGDDNGTQWRDGDNKSGYEEKGYTELNETANTPFFSMPPAQNLRFIMYVGRPETSSTVEETTK